MDGPFHFRAGVKLQEGLWLDFSALPIASSGLSDVPL